MIITHELQKQNLSWQQFIIGNGFETVEEKIEEEQILIVTDDEEEMQHPKATSSKQPMGRRRTRSMVKMEKEFQEKDKIFTTYERKSRKRQQVQKGQIKESDDEAQQAQYAHIQTLEKQKEAGKAQSLEDDDFEEQETSTYEQMREEVKQLIEDMKDETQSPQIVEQIEEMAGGSTSGLDKKGKKIKKMKKKIKEIEVLERYLKTENEILRTQSHKTQEENETLKKKNKKLQKKNKLISKQAYKWFQ
jgi:hypothetical protein